jgi:hypothetical protein
VFLSSDCALCGNEYSSVPDLQILDLLLMQEESENDAIWTWFEVFLRIIKFTALHLYTYCEYKVLVAALVCGDPFL